MSGGLGSGLPLGQSGLFGATPPPNWPAGVPFPPTPGGQGLPPLSGNSFTVAQIAQIQQQQLHLMRLHQQALQNHWMPSISGQSNWIPSVTSSAMTASSSPSGFMKPDPTQPDTLGWREWSWSDADKMLKSPSTGTLWTEAELVVPTWDEGDAVRGTSGIHAHLVPKHWKILGEQSGGYVASGDPNRVHGIVERFGKYVLGTEGWRAEWVIIKELMAPSTEVGLKLEQAYPDVIVHYPEEEGDASCTSATSSKWGKGNRSTSRPKPSPLPSPNSSQASQQLIQTMASQGLQNNRLAQALMNQRSANASLSQSSPPSQSQRHLYGSLSSSESELRGKEWGAMIVMAVTVLPFIVLILAGMGR